jgi:hypothetical protein
MSGSLFVAIAFLVAIACFLGIVSFRSRIPPWRILWPDLSRMKYDPKRDTVIGLHFVAYAVVDVPLVAVGVFGAFLISQGKDGGIFLICLAVLPTWALINGFRIT